MKGERVSAWGSGAYLLPPPTLLRGMQSPLFYSGSLAALLSLATCFWNLRRAGTAPRPHPVLQSPEPARNSMAPSGVSRHLAPSKPLLHQGLAFAPLGNEFCVFDAY